MYFVIILNRTVSRALCGGGRHRLGCPMSIPATASPLGTLRHVRIFFSHQSSWSPSRSVAVECLPFFQST